MFMDRCEHLQQLMMVEWRATSIVHEWYDLVVVTFTQIDRLHSGGFSLFLLLRIHLLIYL